MNIQEQSLKQLSSSRSNLDLILKQLSQNSLAQASKILDQSIVVQLQQKYQQLKDSSQKIVQFLQAFISFLIDNLEGLMNKQKSVVQSTTRQIMTQEYEILQEAVQKSEAQVRKHIRIEHQFKIYLDGLQEQIDEQKKQISILQLKNAHLTQNVKQIEREKRELLSRLQKTQQQRLKPSLSNDLFALSRPYKDVFVSWKYTGNKSKKIIDKIHDRTKISNKKSINKKIDSDKSSNNNLAINMSKKASLVGHQRNLSNNKKDSFKQLIKTVQMKDSRVDKKNGYQITNFNTEIPQGRQYKIYRSNSVCN